MSKRLRLIITALLIMTLSLSVLLVACDNDDKKEAESTITFVSNGGSDVSSITTKNGTTIVEPTRPTKAGYDFAGWYANRDLTIIYEFSVMPAGGQTLYAKWVKKPIPKSTITFDSNGGTAVEPITATNGSAITEPEKPVLNGFRFMGWCKDEKLTSPYKFTTMPEGGIKLYASWSQLYTISFDSNGGSEVDDIEEIKDAVITKPANPNKYGYTFVDWYIDDGTFKTPFAFSTMPKNNIDLFAKWTAKTSSIMLNSNEGAESITDLIAVTYDAKMPSITDIPTRTGYTFSGYFDANGVQYYDADGEAVVIDGVAKKWDKEGEYTLYAKWTPIEYAVRFNINKPEGATVVVDAMDNATYTYIDAFTDENANVLPSCTFEITGYTFKGWATSASGEVVYTDGATFKSNLANTSEAVYDLYAKWVATTYDITYNVNNGEITTDTSTYTYGVGATLSTSYTKVGYTFSGWYTDSECLTGLTDTISKTETGDKTFYAKWTPITYKIRYNINAPLGTTPSASSMEDSTFTYDSDSNVFKACPVTIEGYTFSTWSKDADGQAGVLYGAGDKVTKGHDLAKEQDAVVTIYAIWTPNTYNVTYNVNNGELTTDSVTYTYGVGMTLPTTYTKVGYLFSGWYTDSECVTGHTTAISTTDIGDKTFYAKWTPITYEIKYNVNAPTDAVVVNGDMSNTTFAYDGDANKLATSTLEVTGYRFLGWSDSVDGVVKYSDGETISTNLSSAQGAVIDLYAVWEAEPIA